MSCLLGGGFRAVSCDWLGVRTSEQPVARSSHAGLFLIVLGKALENSKERNRLLRQIAEKNDEND